MLKREINPFQVSDKVTFRNVDKTITLYVRSSAASLVVNLKKAQDRLTGLTDETPEEERIGAAKYFAQAVFGEKQADQLVEFYGEPLAVLSAVGMYFDKQLRQKITKAQKK